MASFLTLSPALSAGATGERERAAIFNRLPDSSIDLPPSTINGVRLFKSPMIQTLVLFPF